MCLVLGTYLIAWVVGVSNLVNSIPYDGLLSHIAVPTSPHLF